MDRAVTLFDAATGAFEHSLLHRGLAVDAVFSKDGGRLATCSMVLKTSGYAQVWNAETGVAITQPLTGEDELHNMRFSPDGSWFAQGSAANVCGSGRPLPHESASPTPARYFGLSCVVQQRRQTASHRFGGIAQFHELWDLGGPAPSWLSDLGEAIGGFALNEDGVVVSWKIRFEPSSKFAKSSPPDRAAILTSNGRGGFSRVAARATNRRFRNGRWVAKSCGT